LLQREGKARMHPHRENGEELSAPAIAGREAPRAARRRIVAMSKRQDKLSPQQWQTRHDAACAIVARKYCDMFGFWRDCKYKLCRSARRCSGDQGFCLQSRRHSVSYDVGVGAHRRMIAETPPDADRFIRMAHYYPHTSLCLHNPKNQKIRAKS
jgi:hypothetical protein